MALGPREARRFREGVARTNYLGQDASDIQYGVKGVSEGMADPTVGDARKTRKLLTYLLGQPRYNCKFKYQK